MLAIETGDRARAPGRKSVLWRAKPKPEMERVDWLGRWVYRRIRERRLVVHDRGRLAARGCATMNVSMLKRPLNV